MPLSIDAASLWPALPAEGSEVCSPNPSDSVRARLGIFRVAKEDHNADMRLLQDQLLDPDVDLDNSGPIMSKLLAYREPVNDVAFSFPGRRLLWSNALVLCKASAVFEEEIRNGRKLAAYINTIEAKDAPEEIATGALDSDDEDGVAAYHSPRRKVTRVEVTDASYKAYRALLTYIRGGAFRFSRIQSAEALSAAEEEAIADADKRSGLARDSLHVSPKSIYVLAEKYGLQALSDQCIASVLRQISASNARVELFTIQALCYRTYRYRLVAHIHSNWRHLGPFPDELWETLPISWKPGNDRSEVMRWLHCYREHAIPVMYARQPEDGRRRRGSMPGSTEHDSDSEDALTWDTDEEDEPHSLRSDNGTPNPKNSAKITYEEGPPPTPGRALSPSDTVWGRQTAPDATAMTKRKAPDASTSPWAKRLRSSQPSTPI